MAKVFRDYAEVNEKLLEGFTVAEVLTGINAEDSGMMLELERTIDNVYHNCGLVRIRDKDRYCHI